MVISNINSIETLDDLQFFVYRTICNYYELLPNTFPTTETVLRKSNGSGCGMMFCLHGPRTVKFSAIWEKDKNRVLFYGPGGERYQQINLEDSLICNVEL